MKIALLHLYLATASGDPRMALSIAKAFKQEGHTVKVYTAEFNPFFLRHLHGGLDIVEVSPGVSLKTVLSASGIINKIIERVRRSRLYNRAVKGIFEKMDKDFDFVFCENDYTYKVGVSYKKINPKARVVWLMNNPPFYHSRKKNLIEDIFSRIIDSWEKVLAWWYSSGIDWAIVYDRDNLKKTESIGIKAKLVSNPLDFDYFYGPVRDVSKNQEIQLLSVGALSPFRRFEDIVTAVSILRKEGYKVKALIICKDYWSDASYTNSFIKFIDDSGVRDFIEINLKGASEEEMLKALQTSHVSVVPNSAKVWVATACEAMAHGLPLVISRATSMVEALRDGKEALFFEPHAPHEIASRIKALLDKPFFYKEIASGGQNYVKNNLSFNSFIRQICEE